jgi:hypothetical protein
MSEQSAPQRPLAVTRPKDNFADLELRELPGMVHWFSPSVLVTTARQALLSAAFGQFADQRTMQAAVDWVDPAATAKRYDYSHELPAGSSEPYWVDYVADLGDGFDSTYAVACQLARDQIKIGDHEMPAGRLLVMGGDEVYPYPNREDYVLRMHYPYELASPVSPCLTKEERSKRRKLFVLPGNHDWYDGLNAFDYYFCGARRETEVSPALEAKQIGRWWCPQHRSYFALRLPHDWWIWGADIQLSQYLDAGQVQYFKNVAENPIFGEKSKVILCVAEPSWLPEHQTKIVGRALFEEQRSKLALMGQIVTERGAKICAILAGDNHHYCRYFSPDLNVNLITAGGGGAYMHPTHQLEKDIHVRWNNTDYPFTLYCKPVADKPKLRRPAVFPGRRTSQAMAWRNLVFPLLNPTFATGLGFFYWVMTWLFSQTVSRCQMARSGNDPLGLALQMRECFLGSEADPPALRVRPTTPAVIRDYVLTTIGACVTNFALAVFALALLGILIYYADSRRTLPRVALGSAHWLAHVLAMMTTYLGLTIWTYYLAWDTIWFSPVRYFWPLSELTYSQAMVFLYPFLCIFIGGGVAATIWGLYLTICCVWGHIHWDHAFSALRIPDYKNFLRIKLEPDKLTIFPIGLRRVPRRPKIQQERPRWWPSWLRGREARILWTRCADTDNPSPPHYFVPPREAQAQLIEPPIEIRVDDIRNS